LASPMPMPLPPVTTAALFLISVMECRSSRRSGLRPV
jgi:hypothetical protein